MGETFPHRMIVSTPEEPLLLELGNQHGKFSLLCNLRVGLVVMADGEGLLSTVRMLSQGDTSTG